MADVRRASCAFSLCPTSMLSFILLYLRLPLHLSCIRRRCCFFFRLSSEHPVCVCVCVCVCVVECTWLCAWRCVTTLPPLLLSGLYFPLSCSLALLFFTLSHSVQAKEEQKQRQCRPPSTHTHTHTIELILPTLCSKDSRHCLF